METYFEVTWPSSIGNWPLWMQNFNTIFLKQNTVALKLISKLFLVESQKTNVVPPELHYMSVMSIAYPQKVAYYNYYFE